MQPRLFQGEDITRMRAPKRAALDAGQARSLRLRLLDGPARAAELHRPARAHIALTGAAPIQADVVRFFRTLGVPLVEVYGPTESTGMIAGHRRDAVKIGTVGEPTPGTQHRIGDAGELRVRGDTVFEGYYKNLEATASCASSTG